MGVARSACSLVQGRGAGAEGGVQGEVPGRSAVRWLSVEPRLMRS